MNQQELALAQRKAAIEQKLTQTGEKTRLKEYVRESLQKCGYVDDLKQHCWNIIRSRPLEATTVKGLVDEIRPHAKLTLPDAVKDDLLNRIKQFIEKGQN
ncbi:unnamed protein product [Blepharisma stoltei]|uniref:Transcription and mRNA export factor ENY2 n=1 Tax=Blepharisma stoltei TaxID=1481888 RepID=A0AAU9II49_9CILI|nr:unnamed protein product [Blepharisma stoltei]